MHAVNIPSARACCVADLMSPCAGAERGKQGVVTMAHVDLAVTEMFRAVHMQLLGNACRLEKILLAALVIETRATGMCLFPEPYHMIPSDNPACTVKGCSLHWHFCLNVNRQTAVCLLHILKSLSIRSTTMPTCAILSPLDCMCRQAGCGAWQGSQPAALHVRGPPGAGAVHRGCGVSGCQIRRQAARPVRSGGATVAHAVSPSHTHTHGQQSSHLCLDPKI